MGEFMAAWAEGGGDVGDSGVNSSAVCYGKEDAYGLFFSFSLALFLCGLHNGQCSVERDPEGRL